jgi:hypothetical protein
LTRWWLLLRGLLLRRLLLRGLLLRGLLPSTLIGRRGVCSIDGHACLHWLYRRSIRRCGPHGEREKRKKHHDRHGRGCAQPAAHSVQHGQDPRHAFQNVLLWYYDTSHVARPRGPSKGR